MQERESVFAAALQNAQDAIGQAKTQENKAAAVDKDHNFISAKLPTTARKLRKIAAAKNIEAKIRSYTAEDRTAMSDQMQELIAAAQELNLAQQRLEEMVKVSRSEARVLIVDELDSVLTVQELAPVFRVLRSLRARGMSVL